MDKFFINVCMEDGAEKEDLDCEDQSILGRYRVEISKEQHADVTGVLDLFHREVPIDDLSAICIEVFNEQGELLDEGFGAEGYSTACVGKITIA